MVQYVDKKHYVLKALIDYTLYIVLKVDHLRMLWPDFILFIQVPCVNTIEDSYLNLSH